MKETTATLIFLFVFIVYSFVIYEAGWVAGLTEFSAICEVLE